LRPQYSASLSGDEASFEVRRVDRFVILLVRGPLTERTSTAFWHRIIDLTEDEASGRIVLDLTEITAVDDVCADRLATVRSRLKERGGELRLRLPRPRNPTP
jgi:anti-anti-sigma regulatory factor